MTWTLALGQCGPVARANKGKGKDGKGKGKGKGSDKGKGKGSEKGKGKAKGKGSKTDGTGAAPTPKFEGYCDHCWKWGHEWADCRVRLKDTRMDVGNIEEVSAPELAHSETKSSDTATVAAVLVSKTESTDWVFGISESSEHDDVAALDCMDKPGRGMMDSGAGMHCAPIGEFSETVVKNPSRTLRSVQGTKLKYQGDQQVTLELAGEQTAKVDFAVSDTTKVVFSVS